MNYSIKYLCFLVTLLLIVGCNKEPEVYSLERPDDQMKLTASTSSIVLEKSKENEEALIFTWNKANDRGEGTQLKYLFRMYMVENNDNETELYEIPADQYSISFTHRQLNDILKGWGTSLDNSITIEAEVIAQVVSDENYYLPELSKTTLDVKGYLDNLEQIYLVIVPDDGTEKQYVRMGESVRGSGIYRTSIDMTNCSYFFSEKADSDYPGYFLGDNGDNSLKFVSEEGTYDMLRYTEEGEHEIIVDLGMMDVRIIEPIYELPEDGIWIVGDACDVGYSQDFQGEVKEKGALKNDDPRYPERWIYTGNFYNNVGESSFKLCVELSKGYNGLYFFAPNNGDNPSTTHELGEARLQSNGGDYKWKVVESGGFTLVVDLSEMTIDLQPAE